jgi:hypothetical protein
VRRALPILFLSSYAFAATATPAYYYPASDQTVLQRVPTLGDPRVREMERLRRAHEQAPAELAPALAVSRAYLDYARSTGDARYLGRAAAVLEPWLARVPVPPEVSLIHATILQSRHDFAGARAELEALLARDPQNEQAWLTLATVELVQGEAEAARRACARLIGGTNALAAGACLAQVNAVTGRAAQAYATLEFLAQREPPQDPAAQAWLEGLMADAARYAGRDAEAERHYRAGLQAAPGDNFLLADYADFLLDHDRAAEALALVRDYSASDTSFLRQVIAEKRLDSPQADNDIAQMAARFSDEARRGSRLYLREQARFTLEVLGEVSTALAQALENWRTQRAPEDTRLVLAAALAANQPEAAREALDFVRRTGLEDPAVRALAARLQERLRVP